MDDELERIWKEVVIAQSRYYPSICPDGLRETMKKSSVRIGGSGPGFEPSTSEYKSTALSFCHTAPSSCLIPEKNRVLFKKFQHNSEQNYLDDTNVEEFVVINGDFIRVHVGNIFITNQKNLWK
jgi:hypothetical protein